MLQLNTPELKYVSYKHGQIAYREIGVGPTLFLLHGMNGNSKSWANLFHSLRSYFRVIAWDAPSFGGSDVFGDSIEEYKNAAKALIEALKLEDIILIGHSMGGLIASQLAHDDDLTVSGLILSSTHLGFACPKGEVLMARYANRVKKFSAKLSDTDYALERARRNTPENTPELVIKFLANVALAAGLVLALSGTCTCRTSSVLSPVFDACESCRRPGVDGADGAPPPIVPEDPGFASPPVAFRRARMSGRTGMRELSPIDEEKICSTGMVR